MTHETAGYGPGRGKEGKVEERHIMSGKEVRSKGQTLRIDIPLRLTA